MKNYLLVILILLIISFSFLIKKSNCIVDKKNQGSGLEYYEPERFDDLILDDLIEKRLNIYLDSLNNLDVRFIKLEKPIEFCISKKNCDDIRIVRKLKNFGDYFIISSTFSFMNKSYGILYSEKTADKLKKYPIMSIRFLKKSTKREGYFYFVEAKI